MNTFFAKKQLPVGMKHLFVVAVIIAGDSRTATAQVAESTTNIGVGVVESTRVALGWSVKKSILGKPVFNDAGEKVGKVDDLIIAPDHSILYLIVGAGGFIGLGRHDVAIPMTQIKDKAGKLVLPGATKEVIKGLAQFDYANDSINRAQFVANARQDIAKAKAKVDELEKKVGAATTAAKVKMDQQVAGLKKEMKAAEDKLSRMNDAAASRWKELESDVSAAIARLRKTVEAS